VFIFITSTSWQLVGPTNDERILSTGFDRQAADFGGDLAMLTEE
jgi:hypothetical protein